MKQDFNFFKTTMPQTRIADYYLGCLDGSVFIDFNCAEDKRIYLRRISFDGYGCCNIENVVNCLSNEDSQKFVDEFQKEKLNQETMTLFVKELINLNKEYIWSEALKEYELIEQE